MDIFAINRHSIKFSLTREELTERGLSADNIDCAGTSSKRLIWELMDRARIENGFECGDARLLVRVFPSLDGGCELFVTLHEVREQKKTPPKRSGSGMTAVLTERDEALFSLCRRMEEKGFRGKSRLYSDEKNRLILLFRPEKRLPSYIQNAAEAEGKAPNFDFAAEYGTVFGVTDEQKAYLGEHGKLLCAENAIGVLAKLAAVT